MNENTTETISILHRRVECDGVHGTVLFEGEVASTSGTWLGIDWDNPARGKHSGTHNGVKYFETHVPNSGSFVRVSKVNFGMDLEAAIRDKYQNETIVKDEVTQALQRSINARFVEVVGMEKVGKKQRELDTLEIIVVDNGLVNDTIVENIGHLIPRVRALELTDSLISSWAIVAEITKRLPTLRFINLSGNKLQLLPDCNSLSPCFDHIDHLVLNHMISYTWQDLLKCFAMFKNLTKIQAAFNHLHQLGPIPNGVLNDVQSIDLGANPISNWKEVMHLAQHKNLKSLNLNHCDIRTIRFNDAEPGDKSDSFPVLAALFIANNPIDTWRSVSELDKLQSLTELVITHDESGVKHFLEFIMARVRNLKMLNRTCLTNREKQDFQLFYLRTFSSEFYEAGGAEDPKDMNLTKEFREMHPSFEYLIKELGAPLDERGHDSKTLADLKLQLHVEVPGNTEGIPAFNKSFLPSTKVAKVAMLLKKQLKLPLNTRVKLSYRRENCREKIEIALANTLCDLHYYDVTSGDTLLMKW